MYKKGLQILAILTTLGLTTCTWDKSPPDYKGYPENIGAIMLTKCATPGCHNDISKDAAGGLSLTSWDKLFEGTVDNAAVVPYRPDQSFLMFSLTRHSSHHEKPRVKFWKLNPYANAPEMPQGYLTTLLICLIPPLWYRTINPKLNEWEKKYAA